MSLKINNSDARRLWLASNGLANAPTGALDLPQLVHQLGFVQLDTIQVVARAHHHILWTRNQNYREPMFDDLYKNRDVFEHYTHDASVIPMQFLPMWQRQFERKKQEIERFNWYKTMLDQDGRNAIKQRIRSEGALSTHAFDTKVKGKKEMWARPPHKLALDYMWYIGELATCYRENFTKYYNLAERVFPLDIPTHDDDTQLDWLCTNALDRLSFATLGEIQKFWEASTAIEVKSWAKRKKLLPVQIQGFDGQYTDAFATSDIEQRLADLRKPTSRLRMINPFDPATRDRIRLNRLFGFDYKIEMFVPAAKRKWGYYVYPLLERDRFIGRIEVKAERAKDTMNVLNLWAERDVRWTQARTDKVQSEIERMARFVGVSKTNWHCNPPN